MKIFKVQNLLILVATLFCCSACGDGRASRYEIALNTCLFQANYNYQERGRSQTVANLYSQAVRLCYKQKEACAMNFNSPVCKTFIRKYPS